MTWVGANDVNAAFSADDLTVFANSLDAGADFHCSSLRLFFSNLKLTSIRVLQAFPKAQFKRFLRNFCDVISQTFFLGLKYFTGLVNGAKNSFSAS